jgi:hypothetical protein
MPLSTDKSSTGVGTAVNRLLGWRLSNSRKNDDATGSVSSDAMEKRPTKWSLGVLNDKETEEVPGKP